MRFRAKPTGNYRLRQGQFSDGVRTLETPEFLPVINIMTGPPSEPQPLLANGGIWKWIKRLALVPSAGRGEALQVRGFLSQVLHFTDFKMPRRVLDDWMKPPRTIREHILNARIEHETPATARKNQPFVFVDSGGYKLLSSEQIDLRAYGRKTRPRDILDLQLAFDGDFIASLDYPVPPNAPDRVAKKRFDLSRRNALLTLRMLRNRGDKRMVYLAVHGRNGEETYAYARKLLELVPEGDHAFGLALGSLVPLNSNPAKLLDSVAGVSRALYESDWDPHRIPLHAFGVNSSVAPFLGLFGVDTYDGTSFVRAAENARYFSPGGYSPISFRDLTELTCPCPACDIMRGGVWKGQGRNLEGLTAVQRILSLPKPRPNYYTWKDGVVDEVVIPKSRLRKGQRSDTVGVPRSYFYALIAMHNLQSSLQHARRLRQADYLGVADEIIATNPSKGKMRQIFGALARHFPQLVEEVREHGRQQIATGDSWPALSRPVERRHRPVAVAVARKAVVVDPTLGPEAFNVNANGYKFPGHKKLVLLVPCSKTKPYSESTLHRRLVARLEENSIDLGLIEKITLSGNYGPVPSKYESEPAAASYDFRLHPSNKERINLVRERLHEFLSNRVPAEIPVVAYVTQQPYRRIVQEALSDRSGSTVLPDPIGRHTSREFLEATNLDTLAQRIRSVLEEDPVAV